MAEVSLDTILEQLMKLVDKVGGLDGKVSSMTDTWARQEHTASNGRAALHNKFESLQTEVRTKVDSITTRVGTIDHEIRDLAKKVGTVEPEVIAAGQEKLRKEGEMRYRNKLVAAVAGVSTIVGALGGGIAQHFLK